MGVARFKQADVTRALKGARLAGYGRVRVGIDVTGNIVIDAGDELGEVIPVRRNPLDRFLDAP